MMKTKQVQHSADDFAEPVPAQGLMLGGARSIVHVPMLQGEQLVGALVIYRQEVRHLLKNRLSFLKILQRKPSSPSRTRGCSMT
jgi:GAF domain-containing protein